MLSLKNFRVDIDANNVMQAVLDVPGRPLNVFDDAVLQDLNEIVDYAQGEQGRSLKMIVFRSGKPGGFLAGADIHRLQAIHDHRECEWILSQGQNLFNKIETLRIPTLAVIHGACVGGGLEFVLACTYRVVVDDPATRLGLPEVKLGLVPAWGGTQRLPKWVGLSTALPMLLQGKLLTAKEAVRSGLADQLLSAQSVETDVDRFINDRLKNAPVKTSQRSLLQWLIDGNSLGRMFALRHARTSVEKLSSSYPALTRIIDAVEIGLQSQQISEAGLSAERSAFSDLILGDVAPHLIKLFLMQEKAKKASTWTAVAEPLPVHRIAVIGAGTMGAGIAQLAASRGYSVLLQDVKDEFVSRGMENVQSLFSKAVHKGAMSQDQAGQALARLQTRVDWGQSDDIDLMIEAIVERMEVKTSVFAKADELLPLHAVLASNTSALPVSEMAQATKRPEKVAGLHFFNPVHKMPLVEVVQSPATSDETIATLVGVAKKLGKVPIVVRQSPGFLVNRILFPYLDEAARLVTEGFKIEEIDREAKKFGMPMGPLELLDVVGIDVALDVSGTITSPAQQPSPGPALFASMVQNGFKGQKSGRGFYRWKEAHRQQAIPISDDSLDTEKILLRDWAIGRDTLSTIQQRLVLAMINEAQKCLAEGIVAEEWMIDLGMVLGTGFAPFRGGPMACLHHWGAGNVKSRLEMLTQVCGPRFTPAPGMELLDETDHEGASSEALRMR